MNKYWFIINNYYPQFLQILTFYRCPFPPSHSVVMSPWAPLTVTISQTVFVFDALVCFEECWSSVL